MSGPKLLFAWRPNGPSRDCFKGCKELKSVTFAFRENLKIEVLKIVGADGDDDDDRRLGSGSGESEGCGGGVTRTSTDNPMQEDEEDGSSSEKKRGGSVAHI